MTKIRAMDIALFVFIFNVALVITNGMIAAFPYELGALSYVNKSDIAIGGNNWNTTASNYATKAGDVAINVSAGENVLIATFSWFNSIWKGFTLMIVAIKDFVGGIFYTKMILDMWGVPDFIGWPIQALIYIIYFIGIAQYLAGRGFKEYQ